MIMLIIILWGKAGGDNCKKSNKKTRGQERIIREGKGGGEVDSGITEIIIIQPNQPV